MRLRNFLLTFPAEIGDPKVLVPIQDMNARVQLLPNIVYSHVRLEKGDESNDYTHYHVLVRFSKPARLKSIQKVLGVNCHADNVKNLTLARHYVQKGRCGNNCTHTFSAHGKKMCKEFAPSVIDEVETGEWREENKRLDLVEARQLAESSRLWSDVIAEVDPNTFARYHKALRMWYDNRPRKEISLELQDWQENLKKELDKEPDWRSIIWFVDRDGGMGKTSFTRWYMSKFEATVLTGKVQDMLYAYKGERVVFVDLPRTSEGFMNYSALEKIKDGVYLSPKYESSVVHRDYPVHVIVFANYSPDTEALSADRWDIRSLRKPPPAPKKEVSASGVSPEAQAKLEAPPVGKHSELNPDWINLRYGDA